MPERAARIPVPVVAAVAVAVARMAQVAAPRAAAQRSTWCRNGATTARRERGPGLASSMPLVPALPALPVPAQTLVPAALREREVAAQVALEQRALTLALAGQRRGQQLVARRAQLAPAPGARPAVAVVAAGSREQVVFS